MQYTVQGGEEITHVSISLDLCPAGDECCAYEGLILIERNWGPGPIMGGLVKDTTSSLKPKE